MKIKYMNTNYNLSGKLRKTGVLFSLSLFLFGAAACSPDTREEDQEVAEEVNTGLKSTEWDARQGQSEWDDKNNENVVYTPEERFNSLDADSDQRLIFNEYGVEQEEEQRISEWDTNNDELYSQRELNEGLFHNWDINRDGALDSEEYQAYNTAWGERYGDNFTTWDRNKNDQLDQEEFDAGVTEAGTYGSWDTDADGVISRDELKRGSFDTRDTNRDNYLTSEEYQEGEYNIWGFNDR